MVTLSAKPEPVTIDLDRTALVVVDIQNAFAKKKGMFDLAGFDISGAAPVIEVNRRHPDGGPGGGGENRLLDDDVQAGPQQRGRAPLAQLP